MALSHFRCLSFKAISAAAFALLAGLGSAQTSQPLAARLDAIFDDEKWENSRWGVMVKDLDTSEVLYQRDANKSFMPASNMKLFTTAASLATLGKDYRFETRIYATGTTDTRGVLHGNIYIVGSGDPSISGRYLEDTPTTAILAQWADSIAAAGIREIEGDIIGDDDIFDDYELTGSWSVDYIGDWYAAESSGLAINDNCWDLNLEMVEESLPPGMTPGIAPRKRLITSMPVDSESFNLYKDIKVVNPDKATSASADDDEEGLSIKRDPNSFSAIISGAISEDSGPVHEWGSIHNGTLYTVSLLKQELERTGVNGRRAIPVSGKAVDIDEMDRQLAAYLKANPGACVHTHVSPPLSRILAIVNKPSQNFYADMLLKGIGAKVHGLGSWSNGEKVVRDVLTTAGVSPRGLNMVDGSGLSRRDQVEPRQVLALLAYMYSRPDFPEFEASLPIMGIDGTLKGRMAGTPAEGNVKAKTGTIGAVRALSGYLTAANGHKIVFSMIANNYDVPTSQATAAQNQAILEIMDFQSPKVKILK